MAYTTIDKPDSYFNTKLWTGNDSSSNAITGVGFQPDFLWEKQRNKVDNHQLFDSVRGVSKRLKSNSTEAETTPSFISSFDSDGFTISTTDNSINSSAYNYVGWLWKAGGTAVSNTDGSITSSVSANTTAGFSIVSYTGTNSGITVGHGLGSVPSMIIFKDRSNVQDWVVNHKGLAQQTQAHLTLNTTNASADNSTLFNNTAPTSSVFSVGANVATNASGANFIAYCFAEKKGFSKFGSYTGNGSTDGTFVYTGFKPAMVILKRTDSAGFNWVISDDKRDTDNPVASYLHPNTFDAESTGSRDIDFLSNGWKLRNSNTTWNASGGTYIYMAFAESPFTTSTGIPTTAR